MHICRGCEAPLTATFADLGRSPPSNEFKTAEQLNGGETTYPLHVYVCGQCKLVQLPPYVAREDMFNENYAYFTSVVPSAVAHGKAYAEHMIDMLKLNGNSFVVEVAGNDGYLLQHFKGKTSILNVEPAESVARASINLGIPTDVNFFGDTEAVEIADRFGHADLIHGANVLAHTPYLHDFISGLSNLLAAEGTITLEFPWLVNLIAQTQLDTIYHEHYSYLSWTALRPIFSKYGLRLYRVERLPTLGGSLRLFLCHNHSLIKYEMSVSELIKDELRAGLDDIDTYTDFAGKCIEVKLSLVQWLMQAKLNGCRVAGFAAPAKATTLLNYAGVGPDLLPYIVDDSPAKIGKYVPGVQIPIYHPDYLKESKPTNILILAWNVAKEIRAKLPSNVTATVPIPRMKNVDTDLPVEPWLSGYMR
jgi:hypothetical protein